MFIIVFNGMLKFIHVLSIFCFVIQVKWLNKQLSKLWPFVEEVHTNNFNLFLIENFRRESHRLQMKFHFKPQK